MTRRGLRHRTSTAASMTDATGLSFTATNGQNGNYHRYAANLSPTKPLGLCIQLHGDGFQEYTEGISTDYSIGGTEGIRNQALYRDMITIVARTPDEAGETWWETGYVCSIYLRDLIRALLVAYPNASRNRIWLVAYSGGSEQVTLYYLPGYSSSLWGGGAMMFGGGGVPDTASPGGPYITPTTSLLANFPIRWWVGDADTGADDDGYDAVQDSLDGYNYYTPRGWTTSRIVGTGNHSAADTRYGALWGQFLHAVENPSVATGTAARATSTSMTWTGTVTNAPAVTLRASTSAFGTQAGTWGVTAVTLGSQAVTATLTGLTAGLTYNWRLEIGGNATHGSLLASGTVAP